MTGRPGGGDGPPSDREIQREYSRDALGLEEGINPRMSLTRMHLRVGSRFVSVWWFLPRVVALCAAVVRRLSSTTATRSEPSPAREANGTCLGRRFALTLADRFAQPRPPAVGELLEAARCTPTPNCCWRNRQIVT